MIISLKVISIITGDDAAGPIAISLIGIFATSILTAIVDVLLKPLKNFLDKNRCNFIIKFPTVEYKNDNRTYS